MPTGVHLHELPPEMLRVILTSFDSLHDLYSLIKASSQCFRIYRITPELILSSVLKRAIHPDALYHALAAVHVDPDEVSNRDNDEQSWQFLDSYFQRDPALLEFPRDMNGIISLAKLNNLVSSLANDYICRTLHALYASEETKQDAPRHALAPCSHHAACRTGLSATEQARIQRAFFRYELFSRCFPVNPSVPRESIFSADEQFNHFIQQMAPWEVEELSCLHEYFWVRVSGIFSDLEEELVARVLDAQTATASTLKASQMNRSEFNRMLRTYASVVDDDGMCLFEGRNLRGLELFSEDERSTLPDIIRYLISLGLLFLRALFASQGQGRRNLIRHNYYGEREFLPHAIYEDPSPFPAPNNSEDISDNNISHVNLGYLLFRPSSIEAVLSAMGIARYWPLRQLGYVFWDIERVRNLEINSKLRDARYCDPAAAKKAFNGFIQESPEARLKGIKLPEIMLQEIRDDYTYLWSYEFDFSSDSDIQDFEEDHE
ncbi:uncharacterized protein TRIVIDRAFT_62247 [Trichoderma virens Gv29-8]|uniref:Uncharacterized protein n=1 Tax=Hypocrea virens (strain Gv29-8 / FGSC 10586) TaxID=413071 RepID=G9MJB2_HYPVG|nr:uncharacterized protein TRIVIDRAFT_62247 [Trichoderma virens Gv29-8]EHK25575.1 hypothetical protein TRIVIDRAFT_62247 [Trichoderma virens Gv29-8]UKZ48604.1 hypothetical protein TrVGV298_002830 [Trichoderma virens]